MFEVDNLGRLQTDMVSMYLLAKLEQQCLKSLCLYQMAFFRYSVGNTLSYIITLEFYSVLFIENLVSCSGYDFQVLESLLQKIFSVNIVVQVIRQVALSLLSCFAVKLVAQVKILLLSPNRLLTH